MPGVRQENLRRLQTGKSEAEVEAVLGRPPGWRFRHTGNHVSVWLGEDISLSIAFGDWSEQGALHGELQTSTSKEPMRKRAVVALAE